MRKYKLKDRNRHVEFTGELVARVDSDDGKAQRWTELWLYHTNTGRYVLSSVGRSVVYHAADSHCSRDAQPTTVAALLDADKGDDDGDFLPCVRCHPANIYEVILARDTKVLLERSRCEVTVCEKAEGLLDALYFTTATGVRRVSGLSRALLDEASRRDEAIAEVWALEKV